MNDEIPLFPLNTVIFPDGLIPLRIFETRYLDMVRDCARHDTGFGIVLTKPKTQKESISIHKIGTFCTISDWERLSDGLLGITAVGQKRFEIKINDTAYDNYFRLMNCSIQLLKKNIKNILNSNYSLRKQNLSNGNYYKRDSVDYKKILNFNMKKPSLKLHNKIRSLIFPPYQVPLVNGIKVKKSLYKNNKIYLIESFPNKFKNK